MITRGRITEILVERAKEDKITDFDVKISFDNMKFNADEVSIFYTYLINYNDGSSFIRIKGQLYGKEDKKTVDNMKKDYEKTKKIPTTYVESVLDSLNAEGIYNGTLISRLLGLPVPLKIPKIRFEGSAKQQ